MKKMMGLLFVLWSFKVSAFTCEMEVNKECCWTPFSVTVKVLDGMSITRKELASITVKKGKSTAETTFNCQPGQQLKLEATFTPFIWEDQKDRVYSPTRVISLKHKVDPQETAWRISTTFPKDFAEVPLPFDLTNCQCEKKEEKK